ncbi:MAG TPA: hypothetical protein VLI04_04035 [Nocardioidaceae bacterium]|nr:hypothetical protein [Nocardioidaceae bacterium]
MTVTADTSIALGPALPPPGPSLGAVVVRTLKSLAVAVFAPAALLAATLVVFNLEVAATIFLGSLLTARPIVARLAPDFYPVTASLAARPGIQGLFRRLTLLWGLVIVVKGSLTLWLLLSLSTLNFVLIKGSAIIALTLVATAATIALSARQVALVRTN